MEVELDPEDAMAYGSWLRAAWRRGEPLLVLEQDTVPPPGGIDGLLRCRQPWCLVPHDCDGGISLQSLGLVRFDSLLLQELPLAAERALAAIRPDVLWELEQLRQGHDLLERARPPALRRQALTLEQSHRYGRWPGPSWPTTSWWWECAGDLARELIVGGMAPHVHPGQTEHLHDYSRPHGHNRLVRV